MFGYFETLKFLRPLWYTKPMGDMEKSRVTPWKVVDIRKASKNYVGRTREGTITHYSHLVSYTKAISHLLHISYIEQQTIAFGLKGMLLEKDFLTVTLILFCLGHTH